MLTIKEEHMKPQVEETIVDQKAEIEKKEAKKEVKEEKKEDGTDKKEWISEHECWTIENSFNWVKKRNDILYWSFVKLISKSFY